MAVVTKFRIIGQIELTFNSFDGSGISQNVTVGKHCTLAGFGIVDNSPPWRIGMIHMIRDNPLALPSFPELVVTLIITLKSPNPVASPIGTPSASNLAW